MTNTWMIRASGGDTIELFESGIVAIGFAPHTDISGFSKEQLREAYREVYPGASPNQVSGPVGMLHRLESKIQKGDHVITYDPSSREYYVGKISSDYYFDPSDPENAHRRKVEWEKKTVSRDDLKPTTRNKLGSTLTLFSVAETSWNDIKGVLSGEKLPETEEEEIEEFEEEKGNLQENARERLKDRIAKLDPNEMEELLASVFRAMGFKATVSPIGPDRGVDVIASPDGLGLQEPRIKAEVKHRKDTKMSPGDIRSFIGALRSGDRGIYLSTGGFTREARYEADRSNVPVTLLDLDALARLIESHYDSFDTSGRTLLPLVRVLWPAD